MEGDVRARPRSKEVRTSSGFYVDPVDDDVVDWSVLWSRGHLGDRLDHAMAVDDLAEDRVSTVQPRGLGDRYEELASVRTRTRIGHGKPSRLIERWAVGWTFV